jgi:enoyl-CoA hydratase
LSTLEIIEVGRVVTVTIQRPDKLNALNAEVLAELTEGFSELEARPVDRRPRAAILTGAGDRAFVAGADIVEMAALSVADARRFSESGQRLGRLMEEASFPILAAVNGFALGGGCELALCADFIFASDRARFGQPEVNLGLLPGFGGTVRLAERIGVGWARRLIYTGEIVDANRAVELGLVDAVVPADRLLAAAHELAQQIATKPPLAVAAAKRSILRGRRLDPTAAADHESLAFAGLFGSQDVHEGLEAFLAKRTAEFHGR